MASRPLQFTIEGVRNDDKQEELSTMGVGSGEGFMQGGCMHMHVRLDASIFSKPPNRSVGPVTVSVLAMRMRRNAHYRHLHHL